jgi:Acetyl-CoA hydrolase/transferase C-terminal domain
VWNYGTTTIPRHLRDVVITEYGVADLRGRTDEGVIAALLNVADARFQDSLKRQAQAAGKLRRDYRIPEMHRNNSPRALDEAFVLPRARGLFSEFPFGTDLTQEEVTLAKALSRLQEHTASGGWLRLKTIARAVISRGTPATTRPYLERMALLSPRSRQEWLWQRLLLQELQGLA